MRVLLLVGVVAAGKSTFRQKMTETIEASEMLDQYAFISSDDIIEATASRLGLTYSEVFANSGHVEHAMKMTEHAYKQALKAKKYIVVDRTNLTRSSRAKFISKAKEAGYEVDAAVFALPMTDAQHTAWNARLDGRPGKVIPNNVVHDMFRSYETPQFEEGISNMVYVNTFEENAGE